MATEKQRLTAGRSGTNPLGYQSLGDEESSVISQTDAATHLVAKKKAHDSVDDFKDTTLARLQWSAVARQSPTEAVKEILDDGSKKERVTISEHLTRPLVVAITHGLLGVSLFGYYLSLFNIPQDTIRSHAAGSGHRISKSLWQVVNGMFPIGAGIGSLTTGYFSDRFGRKKVFLANGLLIVAASLITAASVHICILIVGRLLCGMASGIALAVSSVYLNEISPKQIRGMVGTLIQALITFMIVFSVAIGKLWSSDPLWRLGCALPAFIIAVQLLTFDSFPESPKWLATNDRMDEARTVLTRLRGSSRLAFEELKQDTHESGSAHESLVNGSSTDVPSVSPLTTSPEILGKQGKEDDTESLLKDNFLREWKLINDPSIGFQDAYKESKLLRRVVWVSILINVLQQLAGVNLVFYYSGYLLSEAGVKGAWIGSTVVCLFNWLSAMIIIPYIDAKGRRYWLLISCFGMFLSSLAITVCFYGIKHWSKSIWGYPTVLCLIAYVATFEIGLAPITWLIIGEMTPTRHRATVTAVALLANWTFNLVIATMSTTMMDTLHAFCFLPFGVVCFVGYFWVMKYVPETANKTVMQIMSDIYDTF